MHHNSCKHCCRQKTNRKRSSKWNNGFMGSVRINRNNSRPLVVAIRRRNAVTQCC